MGRERPSEEGDWEDCFMLVCLFCKTHSLVCLFVCLFDIVFLGAAPGVCSVYL